MINIAAWIIALSSVGEGVGIAQAVPTAQPRVVTTTPVLGARISPGPFLLSATFDRPMIDGSYSFVQVTRDTFPDCKGRPTRSPDGRTFTLPCTARAGRQYEVWFNRPPFANFKSTRGAPGKPFRLMFAAMGR